MEIERDRCGMDSFGEIYLGGEKYGKRMVWGFFSGGGFCGCICI